MSNIQVTHDADLNNARSESSLVVNPNNPLQIVSASKRFNNIHTYDFTLATEYSTDGGHTWHDSAALAMPGFTVMTDPTMAWDDAGNVFLVGLNGTNPPTFSTIGIVIYKSTDGGKTWSAPKQIHTSAGDDKQWAAGDTNPASPHHGNVYAVWDDTGGNIDFARTKNHGTTWIGTGAAAAGSVITSGSVYPEIDVSDDGTIYVVSIAGSEIRLMVSTDGGDSFHSATSPATGVVTLGSALSYIDGFPVFPGGNFRVLTDPTACAFGQTVLVAWADYRDGVSRIYFSRSTDGGNTWSSPSGQPLLTSAIPANFQHFHPQIVIDVNGVIGCSFYEFGPKPSTYLIDVIMAQSFDGGASFNHFTVTDQPWNPTVDAPWSHGNSSITFIGDYFGLDSSPTGFYPLWTDTRTGIQELWTAIVPERRCAFIINRSTLGEDEIRARRLQPRNSPGGLPVPDAFRVVVDGFTAAQLGVTGPGSTLAALPTVSPATGMTVVPAGNVPGNGGYGPEVQRFTFYYNLDFPNDSAFGFAQPTESPTLSVTVNTAIGSVSCSGQIELIKQPNPFILHGAPAWLSIDLRVFVVRAGETRFGVTMGADASAAPGFIQQVMANLTAGHGTAGGQTFDGLPTDEASSSLYVYPTEGPMGTGPKVFNFALAKVHYIGLIGATNVRAFFRLFQAQTTSGAYDYPPGAQYRRAASNPAGQPIPLAGIQGNEYVTLPCFALPRIDTRTHNMDQQTDSHTVAGTVLGNVQRIVAHADGSEVDTFFGCWLDINQPGTNVIPVSRDPVHPDGPYQSLSHPPVPIQQAILRNLHQCLIAEIAFDPVAIPLGKDPSNWDKLAQRNLAWSDVGSATAVTTFEIRPTPVGLSPEQQVDELMIDWGAAPAGSVAMLYLPGVDADQIIDMASRMYFSHRFTRVDDHTIQCTTGGITYLPVPPGSGPDYAGLLTVEPPAGVRHGEEFTVVVRQVTNAFSTRLRLTEQPPAVATKGRGRSKRDTAVTQEGGMGHSEYDYLQWRRVLGAFQLTVPVKPKHTLLAREERNLSVLLWIAEAIPQDSRWYPVFERYIDVIGGRVTSFGGDPTTILPSPWGDPRPHEEPEDEPEDEPHHPPHGEERTAHTGKVSSLIFDGFGDFEGFVLDTEEEERTFFSREAEIEELAERAWRERLRITVWAEHHEAHRPLSIVVREPPAPFLD